MSWLRNHRRSAVLIGLTLLIPLYFYLSTLFGLLGLAMDYRADANRLEPRLARLQGLLDIEADLRTQSSEALSVLRKQAYSSNQDPSSLSATVQANVRQIFGEAGLSVTNSQVLPVRDGDQFDRVAVKLTVSGALPALDAALIGVAAHEPRMLVESIDAFPARTGGRNAQDQQLLTAVIQLMVLRALP